MAQPIGVSLQVVEQATGVIEQVEAHANGVIEQVDAQALGVIEQVVAQAIGVLLQVDPHDMLEVTQLVAQILLDEPTHSDAHKFLLQT